MQRQPLRQTPLNARAYTADDITCIKGDAKEVARTPCPRHHGKFACTCGMGHLYRFVEPSILLLLRQKGEAHGYELVNELPRYALTDAEVEAAALYRTLRTLEKNGNVISRWDTAKAGPARRVYKLTGKGTAHLRQWVEVLRHMSGSMTSFLRAAGKDVSPVRTRARE